MATKGKEPVDKSRLSKRSVRHDFTDKEKIEKGSEVARALGRYADLETEFDSIKASYKSRLSGVENEVAQLRTDIVNGFELREMELWITLLPKKKKKEFRRMEDGPDDEPVLVEDMTSEDFAQDLIQAERAFEARVELPLFTPVDGSSGVLVVGRLKGMWYGALRIKIAGRETKDRLDSEQKAYKKRPDCIAHKCQRALEWIEESLGPEVAAGFRDSIKKVEMENAIREE